MIDRIKVKKIKVKDNDLLRVCGNHNSEIYGKAYFMSEIKLSKEPTISETDAKIIKEIIENKESEGFYPDNTEKLLENALMDTSKNTFKELFKDLSKNEEERKEQLDIRIREIIVLGKVKSGKGNIKENEDKKNLAKLESFVKHIDDVADIIFDVCGKMQDLYWGSEDKQSEVKKSLDLLEQNLESQKAINGDSYEKYTKSVKPFIEVAKKDIDSYRKQVQEYKGLSESAILLEKKFKKAVLEYETKSAEFGEKSVLDCSKIEDAKNGLALIKESAKTNLPKMEKELSMFKLRLGDGKQKFALTQECLVSVR